MSLSSQISLVLIFGSIACQGDKVIELLTDADGDVHIEVGHPGHFGVYANHPIKDLDLRANFTSSKPGIARLSKEEVRIFSNSKEYPCYVRFHGRKVGKATITVKNATLYNESQSNTLLKFDDIKVVVRVVHYSPLIIINAVIGWIYFVAWSVSFYPQVYLNWKRKSVVGLNFDFLAYNITGFLAYGLFNVGMFWIPTVERQYEKQHPGGINPVQLNDVVFTLHAILVTLGTIVQCLLYDRGDQRVSNICKVLVSGSWLFAAIALVVTLFKKITWLTYLYYFSYIKIGVTLIKYIPQALMNYRRQSTTGWSIGNVLLDFTGGSFSILQMFLLAYNNDDWKSIFGDLTKFGLGAISIMFDLLFVTQHYCLYPSREGYDPIVKGRHEVAMPDESLDRPVEGSNEPSVNRKHLFV